MEGIQIIGNVKITIKTFTDAKELDVQEDATIKEFREEVCKAFAMEKDQFRLISGGKVLEDKDSLKGLKLTDGSSVYLLPKTTKPQAPVEMPTMSVVNGQSFARLQTKLQETLTSNPETLNSLLSNSTVQQLIANPDVMKSLILNNPLCKDMLESNPDINQILNDGELLRQNVKLAQNQSLLHKMVAGQHRDALNEGDQSAADVDMVASEQLTGPPADMLTSALHMPYMQDMLVAMSQNKDLAKKVMLNSPICTGNPDLQRYMTQTCPNLLNQLSNKNIQAMFTNPQLFTTSLQVHDAMVRLNQEEPSLFASSNMSGVTMPPKTATDSARPVVMPAPTSKAGEPLEQLMHKALDKMCSVKVGPEQCFAFQLEQLVSMGFTDQKRNLAAVQAANGDIASAVDSLKK